MTPSLITAGLLSMTPIRVLNNYTKHPVVGPAENVTVHVRIKGAGVGGCDILLDSHERDDSDCACLWGTVGYKFLAHLSNPGSTEEAGDVPNEVPLCSDTKSLGNCYHTGSYFCYITQDGLCHCQET